MIHLFIYIYIVWKNIYQSIAIIISCYLILKKTNDPNIWFLSDFINRIKPKKWWKKHKNLICMVNWLNYSWLVFWNMSFIFPYIGNNFPNWLSYFSKGLKPPTSHPIVGASSFVKHPFALNDAEKATINEKGLWCYHQMYETKWKKA